MESMKTYIVNLEKRKDRKRFVLKQFRDRSEFEVEVINAIEHTIPAFGLYQSLCKLIEIAKIQNLPYILFCEDDHQFTEHYDDQEFIKQIVLVDTKKADLLLGGVSWFDYGVKLSSNLYWINGFTGMQFAIIFSRFYDSILNTPFSEEDVIDKWISNISENIYLFNPFISTQKYFGYSDVTTKNNNKDVLDKYFTDTSNKLKSLDEINCHILNTEIPEINQDDFDGIQIPVYIINLKNRLDRLTSVLGEFHNRNEFNIEIVEAFENTNGALGLWMSIRKVISLAKERGDEIIIICEDDHVFTEAYDKVTLFKSIFKGAYLGADILLGGLLKVNQAIIVDENLCWISEFYATQFVIIYNNFFDSILNEKVDSNITADGKFSEMTSNKYVIHPFISIQQNFGYSDIQTVIHPKNSDICFNTCSNKIKKIKNISNLFTV